MIRDPARLAGQPFDLLVIGGGIIGAGILWDASLRGLSCALVEQADFASGTSSKTTKLIHGGIRYLEQLEFGLVRQAIRERQNLLRSAPQLVKPLPFLIPVIGNSPRPWPIVALGVTLYDWLAGKASLQRCRLLDKFKAREAEPLLGSTEVKRAALYHDAQMDDTRLVLETLQSAANGGAVVANYCSVNRFLFKGDRIAGAEVQDRLKGAAIPVRAAVVVNATGPWADQIRRLASAGIRPIVRMSKGIHLVYPDIGLRQALVLSSPADRRIFFLIPWRKLTLIGTTDTDYQGDPGQAAASPEEIDYLLAQTNRLLPNLNLVKGKAISTFAGIRPLIAQEKKDPWAVSRSHRLQEDPNGLISVVGGKFTTFRAIAEEVVGRVARRFPGSRLKPCETAGRRLGPQLSSWSSPEVQGFFEEVLREGVIPPSLIPHLAHRYGGRSMGIIRQVRAHPDLKEPLCPHHPFILAEIRYAVESEMAVTLSDLLWRRLQIGHSICQGLDAAQTAAQRMGECLGWDDAEVKRQMERYRAEVADSRSCL